MGDSDRLESSNALYRIVSSPDGKRFEIEAADDFVQAAGAPPGFDIILIARAVVRRLRGRSWRVTVRDAGSSHDIVVTKHVATKQEAESEVAELVAAIEAGGFPQRDQ